jgi:hypothetical protein
VLSGDAFLRSIGAQALRGGLAKNPLILTFFNSSILPLGACDALLCKESFHPSHLVVFSSKSLLFTHIWTKIALFSSKSLLFGHIWTKIVGSLLKKN